MSPPIPKDKREWLIFCAGPILFLVLLGMVFFGKSGCDAYAEGSSQSLCEIEREALLIDLKTVEEHASGMKTLKDTEIADLKKELKEREAFWQETYEGVRQEKSGEWCWNELKDLEYDLEGEKKMCIWRMKSAGHLRFRTDNAIRKCDTCIKQHGIKKPKIPNEKPADWKKSNDWAQGITEFTEAEIEKIND